MEEIAGFLLREVLTWLADRIARAIAQYEKDKSEQAANKTQAAADIKKASELTPDSTAEEVSSAIDDASKHF